MLARKVYFPALGKTEIREESIADPAADEVQVRCLANGICMAEVTVFTGQEPRDFSKPQEAGHEGLGVVVKVGKNVTNVQEGDHVVCWRWTTLANLKADGLIRYARPAEDPALAFAEPASCIVTAYNEYQITPGDRVLLVGAGYMGLLNVQALARSPLAELVVSDVKKLNLKLAQKYGATEVINSATTAGTERLKQLEEKPFDLVIECSGVASVLASLNPLVRRGGRLAIFSWHHGPRTLDLGYWHTHGIKVPNVGPAIGTDRNLGSMRRAVALLESGLFDQTKMITHRFPLDRVQEAMELSAQRPEGFVKSVLTFD